MSSFINEHAEKGMPIQLKRRRWLQKGHGKGAEKRARESEFKARELLLGFQPMLGKIPLENVLETSGSEFADSTFHNWNLY